MASIGTLNLDFQTNVATLINDMRRASSAVEQSSNRMDTSLRKAALSLKSFIAGYVGLNTISGIVRISDEFTKLEGRLRNATRDAYEFQTAYDGLRGTAARTGASFEGTFKVFERLSLIREDIGASNAEMLQFTDTVTKLGVLSGAGTDELRSGLTQLAQGLSAGVLRAEEFNSIMENIPAIGRAIADQLGVTTGQLRQMVIEGEVLSEDVFRAILRSASDVDARFKKMPPTIERAGAAFNLEFEELINKILKSSGLIDAFIRQIEGATAQTKLLSKEWDMLLYTIGDIATAQLKLASQLTGIEVDADALNPRLIDIDRAKKDVALYDVLLMRLKDRVAKTGIAPGRGFQAGRLTSEQAVLGGVAGLPVPARKPEVPGSFIASTASFKEGAKAADKQAEAIKRVIEALSFQNEQFSRSANQQELYNQLRAAGTTIDTEAGQRIAALVEMHQALEKAQKRQADIQADLQKRAQQGIEQHMRAFNVFNSVVEQGLRGQIRSWKDLGAAILAELQNILVAQYQMQATNSSSPLGSVLGSVFGLFSPKLSNSATDLAFDGRGLLFAKGGVTNKPAIFGEAGPEAAVPLPDGRSIPVKFTGRGGGGGTYYIDARGADSEGLRRLEAQIKALNGSIEHRALSAVKTENARNPRYLR